MNVKLDLEIFSDPVLNKRTKLIEHFQLCLFMFLKFVQWVILIFQKSFLFMCEAVNINSFQLIFHACSLPVKAIFTCSLTPCSLCHEDHG